MKISFDNVWASVDGSDAEHEWLTGYLQIPNASFAARRRGETMSSIYVGDRFPAGLVRTVKKNAEQDGFTIELVDLRGEKTPANLESVDEWDWARDYQTEAALKALVKERGIIKIPGGCHRAGQRVVMADGSTKRVEHVKVGDRLVGDDGSYRTVQRLHRGVSAMVRVIPKRGESFVVTENHILTLVRSAHKANTPYPSNRGGRIIDIAASAWFTLSDWDRNHGMWNLLRSGPVEFEHQNEPLPIDPYFLGVLLGDGALSSGSIRVCKPDNEIRLVCEEAAQQFGLSVYEDRQTPTNASWCLTGPRGKPNRLIDAVTKLGLRGTRAGDKFVPTVYKTASVADRLRVLAGLLDTDGHLNRYQFDWISKSKQLYLDICFIARSLGFSCFGGSCRKSSQNGTTGTYWRVCISGDTHRIPTRIPRKQAQLHITKKHHLRTGLTIERLKETELYYGFELDGNGRYLLDDFTITHNSGKTEIAVMITWAVEGLTLFLCEETNLAEQMHARWRQYTNTRAGRIIGGKGRPPTWDVHTNDKLVCATYSQIRAQHQRDPRRVCRLLESCAQVIVDECHGAAATHHSLIIQRLVNARRRIGLSATPLDRLDRRNTITIGAFGPIIYRQRNEDLVARKLISQGNVYFVRCHQLSDKKTLAGVRRELIVRSRVRNNLAVEIAKVAKRPVIVFVKIITHGQHLEELLLKAGLRARFIWGTHSPEYREQARKDLVKDRLDVVIANKIWHQGINIVELASIVNLASGKSVIETLQRAMRASRVVEGQKYEFDIWDIYDSGQKWLERHSREREKAYERVGYRIQHLGETP